MVLAEKKMTSIERHKKRFAHVYANGVLKPADHSRLVEDLDFYAAKAGVPPEEIYRHASETLNDRERMWVRQVIRHGKDAYGYALMGGAHSTKTARCRAMVAGCVRNFRNARFVTADALYRKIEEGDPDIQKVTLVACPDFVPDSGSVEKYRRPALSSWLIDRLANQKYVVIGISGLKAFEANFGVEVKNVLLERFEATVDPGKKG